MSKEKPSSRRMRFGYLDEAPAPPTEKEMNESARALRLKQYLKKNPTYAPVIEGLVRDGLTAGEILDILMPEREK
jgi:hypothetical protein